MQREELGGGVAGYHALAPSCDRCVRRGPTTASRRTFGPWASRCIICSMDESRLRRCGQIATRSLPECCQLATKWFLRQELIQLVSEPQHITQR
eukprot:1162694-Pleurochrysis_carterae.AAC.2